MKKIIEYHKKHFYTHKADKWLIHFGLFWMVVYLLISFYAGKFI